MITSISRRWRLLSGKDNWRNLLQPLDDDLRRYIIHYGERAQATYDTFNSDRVSKYAGSSRYAKSHLFSRVGLENGNPYKYKVVKYIYATSNIIVPNAFLFKSLSSEVWCKESNWMGYVAVATDEGKEALGRRDILVAWRGTVQPIEWFKDFDSPLVSASKIIGKLCNNAKVHRGVLSIYCSANPQSQYNKSSARDQVLSEVSQLVETFSNEEISITIAGHSLGAVLSTLNAVDIVANGYNKPNNKQNQPCPVTAFVFGSPRVGDSNFRDVFQSMEHLHLLRVRNVPDVAPLYPPIGYVDVGHELLIDSRNSTYLKYPGDLISWHDLEAAYLHRVAGTRMKDGEFIFNVKRDLSLVNKSTDALKDEYLVPIYWWIEKNKGMVQRDDGTWNLEDHEKDDD